MFFEFDDRDQKIMIVRMANRDQIDGPRLGDYVRFKDGQLERFSHDWGNSVQTSPHGSFYLANNGYSEFSGGLNPPIPHVSLSLTKESMPGTFWFFHHSEVGAHRGVRFNIPCRVYETKADYEGFMS